VKATLDGQIKEREAKRLAEKEESRLLSEKIRAEAIEQDMQAKREVQARVQARKKQDDFLIAQMTFNTLSTKDDRMNRDGKNKDVIVNRGILRLMKQEGADLATVTKLI
jgi:hypothetical protein